MEKDCPVHGHFEETLSTNPAFTRRIERLFPGRDFDSSADPLHDHGPSSIRYGRGGVLTIDLTNRCNMMCDPCFMNANQVDYVHELSFDEVKRLIDNALTIRPKRQISIQFSGGEPTLSPIFLESVAYARKVGYFSVQAATNGIRFAQDAGFARAAAEAGLRIAYLQFDGVGEEANAHRKVPNLFEVKLRAIENLYQAGIDVVLVVTVVRTVNDHQVGRIVKFARRERGQDQLRRRSSRCPSPAATRTSTRSGASGSGTRCRSWSTTCTGRPARSSRCATGSRCRPSARRPT